MATIDLVLYKSETNQIKLYRLDRPFYNFGQWLGEPFIRWSTLEICIERGWEIIGEI